MEKKIFLVEVNYIDYFDESSSAKQKFYKVISTSKQMALDAVEKSVAAMMVGRTYEIIRIETIGAWSLVEYVIMSTRLERAELIVDDDKLVFKNF